MIFYSKKNIAFQCCPMWMLVTLHSSHVVSSYPVVAASSGPSKATTHLERGLHPSPGFFTNGKTSLEFWWKLLWLPGNPHKGHCKGIPFFKLHVLLLLFGRAKPPMHFGGWFWGGSFQIFLKTWDFSKFCKKNCFVCSWLQSIFKNPRMFRIRYTKNNVCS